MSCNRAKIYNKLEIINLQKHYPIDKKRIKKIVRNVLKLEKKDAELQKLGIKGFVELKNKQG